MHNDRFLLALRGENQGRPPVWLMRQAGRYLPEYRILREKHSLYELFFTPELAAKITQMPLQRFALDAAILFSDITAIAPAMGLNLSFDEGPIVTPHLRPNEKRAAARLDALSPIFEAIRLIKAQVNIPLIGFCGAPFTVASYLIERHEGHTFTQTFSWMQTDPKGFLRLLDEIADLSIAYLQEQIKAGANAVQVFDSWANVLGEKRHQYCYPYLKKIARAVNVPVIAFMRGSAELAKEIAQTGCIVSVDESVPIKEIRRQIQGPLQGNFDPNLLFCPPEEIRRQVRIVLEQMQGDRAFIANLGHGVKVGTPLEAVAAFVDEIVGC